MVSSLFLLSFLVHYATGTSLEIELNAWKKSDAGQLAKLNGFLPLLESTAEELNRFNETKQLVNRLNRMHPKASFSVDTPFTLLTTAEFATFLQRSFKAPQPRVEAIPKLNININMEAATTIDWTTTGCVNEVQNQGQCGSCWAFASISAVETSMCLESSPKTLLKLSEQQLTSCDTASGNLGCQGGYPNKAFEYVAAKGVCLLKDYPYVSGSSNQDEACRDQCNHVQTGVHASASVPRGDSGMLSVLQHQTVVAGVSAGNDEWKQYKGGVLSTCSTTELDHAVVVVGYTESEWKIQNSWSAEWGDRGFMYIQRTPDNRDTNGVCGLTSEASYPSKA